MNVQPSVVILAGGEATRFPGKLERTIGGAAVIVRVYRNVRDIGPVLVAANRSFSREIEIELDCPIIVDRWPRRGPLAALYSAFAHVDRDHVFVVAGDAPLVTRAVFDQLLAVWEEGLQACVPVNRFGHLEPLCALYERIAFLEHAGEVLRNGSGSVAAVVERLRAKRVSLSDERALCSLNTTADSRAFG